MPAFSHMIKHRTIHMNSYRMDSPLLDAFVKHVNKTCFALDVRKAIESVVINDCGFSDQQVGLILRFLT